MGVLFLNRWGLRRSLNDFRPLIFGLSGGFGVRAPVPIITEIGELPCPILGLAAPLICLLGDPGETLFGFPAAFPLTWVQSESWSPFDLGEGVVQWAPASAGASLAGFCCGRTVLPGEGEQCSPGDHLEVLVTLVVWLTSTSVRASLAEWVGSVCV